MNGFLSAGDFTAKERLLRAIRNNIPMMLIYFVAFIAIIIILLSTVSGRVALEK